MSKYSGPSYTRRCIKTVAALFQDAQSISDGNKFAKAVQVASNSPQLVAVGVNCSSPALVKPLLESAKSHKAANMSWVVYPNSGEEWDPSTG